jgi:uncharacterized protein
MTQPAKASEPSMEEILASIRRIIADDDTTKLAQPEPEVSRIPAAAHELFEEQPAETAPASQPAASRATPIPDFADVVEPAARGKPDEPQLVSRQTSAAVDAAFNKLAQTVRVSNARTLEDLVRAMLRPMLKSWLDENLPRLVERLVRTEIERVSRGPRA